MALFKIHKGEAANLPLTKTEGYAYFTTDEGCLYIDISDTERVQVNALSAEKLSKEIVTSGGDYMFTLEPEDILTINDLIDVEHGGTGLNEVPENAVLVGDDIGIMKTVSSASGAMYATGPNAQPQFGTLPVAQGGIGAATLPAGGILKGNGTGAVTTLSGVGALYAATSGAPSFGTLPISVGGTGATSAAAARANLDVYSKDEIDDSTSKTVSYAASLSAAGWSGSSSAGYTYTYSKTALTCGATGDVPPIITWSSNQEDYSKITSAIATAGVGIVFTASAVPTSTIGLIIIDVK